MSQLRGRRQHFDSSGAQTALPVQPLTADSQADQPHGAAAAQDRANPGNGPPAAADPVARQTRGYRPGAAVLGVLRFALRETVYVGVIVVLAVWAAQSYFGQYTPDKVLFPPERLAKVDGVSSSKVYLAVLGTMFDVTKGRAHYGPKGSYHGFAGKDASRAFVTGNFDKDLTDDLTGLEPKNLAALVDWRKFYMEHKVYKHMGRVTGRFYTADGNRTAELDRVEAAAAEYSGQQPYRPPGSPCSVQWSASGGKEVWCSQGKGFPRRAAAPAGDAAAIERCECSEQPVYGDAARLYDGCPPSATRCRVREGAAA